MDKDKNPSEIEKIKKDLLWGQYLEFRNHARHSEILRSNVNNYILVASAGLGTIIALGDLHKNDLVLSGLLIALGIVGALFSASYTELYQRYRNRASGLIKELDNLFFVGTASHTLYEIRCHADKEHYGRGPNRFIQKKTDHHWFWLIFPAVPFCVGIVLTFVILIQ